MSYSRLPSSDTVAATHFDVPTQRRNPEPISFLDAEAARLQEQQTLRTETEAIRKGMIAIAIYRKGYAQGHLTGSMRRARFVFVVGLFAGCIFMAVALALGLFIGG